MARANETIRAFLAAHPDRNATAMACYRDGGWDFLNESRMTLAMSQFAQLDVEGKFQPHVAAMAARNASVEERRAEGLLLLGIEENRSRADLAAFYARLRATEASFRTTHGLEYALFASFAAVAGEDFLRGAENGARQFRTAPFPDDRLLGGALLVVAAPQSYVSYGHDLLDLAQRADSDVQRPQAPANASATLHDKVALRLAFDPEARSTTGPASTAAASNVRDANVTGPILLYVARFLDFQQARTSDALEFKRSREELTPEGLQARAQVLLTNTTFLANYDGQLVRVAEPGLVALLRSGGHQAIVQIDAENHALYRVRWDPGFGGLSAGWASLVAARYAGELLLEVPSPRSPGGGGDWMLYGGIAVAAALGVAAYAVLRKPHAP
jgi:hypothetical protein